MAWLTETQIREAFDLTDFDIPSGKIVFASQSAASKLRDWIDSTYLTDVVDALSSADADVSARRERLQIGHAYLTMSFLFSSAPKIRNSGVIVTEQDAGSPATSTTIVNRYSATAAQNQAAEYLSKAKNMLSPYALFPFNEGDFSPASEIATGLATERVEENMLDSWNDGNHYLEYVQ